MQPLGAYVLGNDAIMRLNILQFGAWCMGGMNSENYKMYFVFIA